MTCCLPSAMPTPRVLLTLITRFTGPTWGPSGADRTQVGPMVAPWTLLYEDLLSNRPPSTNLSEIVIKIPTSFSKKIHLKILSIKWRSVWSALVTITQGWWCEKRMPHLYVCILWRHHNKYQDNITVMSHGRQCLWNRRYLDPLSKSV